MSKSALITGVTGQDGSYLAELLLSEGYEVVGLARRSSTSNTSRIDHVLSHENFRLVRGDVTDSSLVTRLIHNGYFDEVYNLAAHSFVGASFEEPKYVTQVNLNGCLNCLEAIRQMPAGERPRFYQASTSEMFGKSYSYGFEPVHHFTVSDDHPIPESMIGNVWQNEDTPFVPASPYAVAKLAAHNLVKIYREAYGVFACSGILFNHESPRRGEEFVTRKITKYIGKLSAKGFDKVGTLKLGNIDACRDWGHAKDYVRGQVLMLRQDTPDDYVLATGQTQSVRRFLDVAFGKVNLKWQDYVEISPSEMRPSEVPYLRGIATKAEEQLGWKPEISFDHLVEDMLMEDLGRESGWQYGGW